MSVKIKNFRRERWKDRLFSLLVYLFVGAFAIVTLLPFLFILAGSFSTEKELTERAFFIFPRVFSLNAYRYILSTGDIFRGLGNSIIVTLGGTLMAMIFTTTFAYPLSKPGLTGRNLILNLVIITMVFSGGLIPSYLLISGLGMTNSFSALIIPGAINAFNLIILKHFFSAIPTELEESARLDGCNDLGIFVRIVLPLSKAALASVALFYAVSLWNDYFNAMIYINDPRKEVVQITLRRIVLLAGGIQANMMDYAQFGMPPDKAVKMAATIVSTLPILLIYPFIQKHFTKGVMIGAVKG